MKKTLSYCLFAAAVCALVSVSVFAAAFEDIGVGARARGMAGVYTAVTDDANSIYWNPASIARSQARELTVFYQDMYNLGLLNYSYVGYVHPKIGRGSVGFGWVRLGTSASVDFMDYSENTYIFSYGHRMGNNMSLGANLKYFSVNYDYKASGYGFDFAANYDIPDYATRLSLVWRNSNTPQIRWETEAKDNLPSSIRLAVAWKVRGDHQVSLEGNQESGDKFHMGLGWEGWFLRQVLGFRIGVAEQDTKWNPALGFSLSYKKTRFDYSWEKHYSLGNNSLFSVSIKF